MLQTPENYSCWFITCRYKEAATDFLKLNPDSKVGSPGFYQVLSRLSYFISITHYVFSRDWILESSYTILRDRGPVQHFPPHSTFLPCWPWSINSCSPTRATWGTRSGWLCSAGNIQSSFITFPATSTTSSLIQTSPETKIPSGLHIITAMAKSWYFTGPGLSTTNFLEGWKEFKQSIVIKVIIDDFCNSVYDFLLLQYSQEGWAEKAKPQIHILSSQHDNKVCYHFFWSLIAMMLIL